MARAKYDKFVDGIRYSADSGMAIRDSPLGADELMVRLGAGYFVRERENDIFVRKLGGKRNA